MVSVVAAAVLRERRLLACRRTATADRDRDEAAGRWELPGGKVEAGETADAALVRELAEELGVEARVTRWLDGVSPIGRAGPAGAPRHELRVATVAVAGWTPWPRAHDRLRWLRADELDEVDWLEPDRPFLPRLRPLLASR